MTHPNATKQSGFTLIELSIVLVIIGLIVGGVLVGQDLIKGAEIRAGISQLEKYDAAANTFRNKYGGLPGDVSSPANFGFDANYDAGFPNSNGRLQSNADDGTAINNESVGFFRHLFQANLIAENIVGDDFQDGNGSYDQADTFPLSKVGGGTYVIATSTSGLNYYYLARGATYDSSDVTFSTTGELSVIDAFQIDSKMDDGVPNTGRIIAVDNINTADTNGDCHAAGVYATAASANQTVCTLRIRTSF